MTILNNSLEVDPALMPYDQITLVDDVLTMGRSAFACALKLHEAYPSAEIRTFAVVRTQGQMPDIQSLWTPRSAR